MMPKQPIHQGDRQAKFRGERFHVTATALVGRPATIVPDPDAESEEFTREVFEGALDKVSRPLKGRLAHVPYSSDDLIKDKRTDVELEDRDS
jgi:hypothetical protein